MANTRALGARRAAGRPVQARRTMRAAGRSSVKAFALKDWEGNEIILKQWGEPRFHAVVEEEFPDKGVATVEEARVLKEEFGYTYLDVRSDLEVDSEGVKIPGSVNIPIITFKKVYDAEAGKKIVKKEPNEDFVSMIEKKFPNKEEAKFIVACSGIEDQGEMRAILALEELDEAGYENIVFLQQGYVGWNVIFDNKQQRRRLGGFKSVVGHEGSTGIFDSGAGYANQDPGPVTGFKGAFIPPSYLPGGMYYDEVEEYEEA